MVEESGGPGEGISNVLCISSRLKVVRDIWTSLSRKDMINRVVKEKYTSFWELNERPATSWGTGSSLAWCQ